MSFTYLLANNTGKVRLWIKDTNSGNYDFSDEEIDAILTQFGGDVKQAAANLFFILAGDRARLAKRKSAGKYSEDLTQISTELRAQAKAILETTDEPYDTVVEQTFGPLGFPYEGSQEKEFIDREHLRGQS